MTTTPSERAMKAALSLSNIAADSCEYVMQGTVAVGKYCGPISESDRQHCAGLFAPIIDSHFPAYDALLAAAKAAEYRLVNLIGSCSGCAAHPDMEPCCLCRLRAAIAAAEVKP